MAKTYSSELEVGLGYIVVNCEEILKKINAMRVAFEDNLTSSHAGWREYHDDILVVFETINSVERATFMLIENTDIIRRKNDSLMGG